MRLALVLLALAACQKPSDHPIDPAVGRWRGETGKTIELRADGTLDMAPIATPQCENESALLATCKARQRWARHDTIVALTRGTLSGTPCECRTEVIDVQLREDELVFGREHAQRVK